VTRSARGECERGPARDATGSWEEHCQAAAAGAGGAMPSPPPLPTQEDGLTPQQRRERDAAALQAKVSHSGCCAVLPVAARSCSNCQMLGGAAGITGAASMACTRNSGLRLRLSCSPAAGGEEGAGGRQVIGRNGLCRQARSSSRIARAERASQLLRCSACRESARQHCNSILIAVAGGGGRACCDCLLRTCSWQLDNHMRPQLVLEAAQESAPPVHCSTPHKS